MPRHAFVLVTLAGLAGLGVGSACLAQTPAEATGPAAARAEPQIERRVIEDEGVRIEQLHYRGQAQRVTVQSKVGQVRPYEIVVGRSGRDPSLYQGSIGQSRWSLVSF
jgi:hypothetical protein